MKLSLLVFLLSASLHAQTATELRRVPAAEAHQGVASDARFLYAIDDSEIGKYDKATGKRIAGWKGDHDVFIHINSCSVIRAELVCAMSNFPQLPMASSVEWFSTTTMKHLRSHSFGPLGPGSLTWIEWHDGSWYACFANYDAPRGDPTRDHNATVLVRYTADFTPKESWLFPKNVLKRFGHMSASGGRFSPDGLLYVTGHDLPEMYVLRLPNGGQRLEYLRTIAIPTNGQAFDWEFGHAGKVVWTIERKKTEAVESRLP